MRDPTPKPFRVPPPKETESDWAAAESFEDPKLQVPGRPRDIRCFDPATGQALGVVHADTKETVAGAVDRARKVQVDWAKTSFGQRRSLLRSLLDFIVENQETICRVASKDTGKTGVDGRFGEILTTTERLRWTIANGEAALKSEQRWPGLMMCYKTATVEYRPCGVVAALVSWNYPFHNVFGPIITGLFAGNAVVVKVSEHVAWSARYFKNIIDTWLTTNGYSENLVQFVIGYADVGEALVQSEIDKVTFIGSAAVGKQVMKAAADKLTPCVLELGGKDFAIIRADVEFDRVLHILMRGTFQNAGQNCIGLERIIAHANIYDKLVEELSTCVKTLRVGAPLEDADVDVGAMVLGPKQFERLTELIASAVAAGARLLHGGKRYAHPRYPAGQYFMPTLLVDVTPDMDIANEECFAPIMVVMKYGTPGGNSAADDDQAVEIVNRCAFRLGGSVFSKDVVTAEAIARRCKCGMMNVNDFASSYLCNLPFGGVGHSGYDRFNGVEGLRGNCFTHAVTKDRFDLLGVRTAIPPPVRYPIEHTANAVRFLTGMIKLIYTRGVTGRMHGLRELILGAMPSKPAANKAADTKTGDVKEE